MRSLYALPARVRRGRRVGLLTDAFALPSFAHSFLAALAAGKEFACSGGLLRFRPTETGRAQLAAIADAEVHWLAAEHANSSLTVGDVAMLKIYRRISPGEHPETEIGCYLTAQGFSHAPPLLGDVVRVASDGTPFTLAIAFGFVRNEGDAWSWTLDHLTRALDARATPAGVAGGSEADLLADCEAVVGAIGRRLGEMHTVLARPTTILKRLSNCGAAKISKSGFSKKIKESTTESTRSSPELRSSWERCPF